MKKIFNALDIRAIIAELRAIILNSRVVNVYDVDNKTYLIKLNDVETTSKNILLLECGHRIHLTMYDWNKNQSPSGFSMKMRKHVKNKRITAIEQVGFDRSVRIQFGSGEASYNLIIELYDKGNMIFTDCNFVILHLLRPRVTDENKFITNEKLCLDFAKKPPIGLSSQSSEEHIKCLQGQIKTLLEQFINNDSADFDLTKEINSLLFFGKDAINHCLVKVGISLSNKKTKGNQPNEIDPETKSIELTSALRSIYHDLSHNFKVQFDSEGSYKIVSSLGVSTIEKGYITGKNLDKEIKTYTDFFPFKYAQIQQKELLSFDSYNRTVDEFFSKLELQKNQQSASVNEKKAIKKLTNIKKDQEERLLSLKEEQSKCFRIAEIIKQNNDLVNQAILMINHAIANQVSWPMIRAMVEEATDNGNPVAAAIQEIMFEKNQITLRLYDIYEDSDGEQDQHAFPDGSYLATISLDKNAMTNASSYYDRKKAAMIKEEKTLEASKMVMKKTQKKVSREVNKLKDVKKISMNRKQNWFEKFYWFISSENYLILAGRDATQNDMLFKKYFNKDDIFVHANTRGSSAVIVKNRCLTQEEMENPKVTSSLAATCGIPMKTLIEAGSMAICLSSAWSSKVLTEAWWVTYDQVSKTAPSGEYLSAGSFMIRGKKNFLTTHELSHGFGIIFKLSPESVAKNHACERRITMEETNEDNKYSVASKIDDQSNTVASGQDNYENESSTIYPDIKINIDFTKKPKVQPVQKSVPIKENKIPSIPPTSKKNESKTDFLEKPAKRGQKGKTKIKRINKEEDEWNKLEKNLVEKLSESIQLSDREENPEKAITEQIYTENNEANTENADDLQEPKSNDDRTSETEDNVAISDDEEDVKILHKQNYSSIELDFMDSFTGNPKDNDEILYAMPICAPHTTISKWKYQIKLTPGQLKRGPAVNSAKHHFIYQKDANEIEQNMIRILKDEDCVRFMLNQVSLNIGKNVKR